MSLVGIGVGSLLVVTMLALFGSLTGSVRDLADLAGGAEVEVAAGSDAGIDQAIVDEVLAVDGVAAALPIVRTRVVAGGVDALLVGADAGEDQRPPAGLDPACVEDLGPAARSADPTQLPVAIGAGLADRIPAAVGDTFTAQGAGAAVTVRVVGVIDCPQASRLDNGTFVATIVPIAQIVSGRPDRIDSVFVTPGPGVDTGDLVARLTGAVGDKATVGSPRLRAELAEKAVTPLQQGLLTAITLALIVAGFLVFNTMSMAALERRRELATLRAIGGRRRTLLVHFMAEAALLGLIGSTIGAVLGVGVARAALTQVPAIILDFLGVSPRFILPPTAVPTGIAVGVVATLVAAYFPARAAVRVAPVEAMRPEGVLEVGSGRDRNVVAAAGAAMFVGGSILTTAATGGVTLGGFAMITVGLVVLTYGLTVRLARVVSRVATPLGATGRLAAAGIERAPRRVWATTLAVTIAVGVVLALGGVIRNQETSFTSDFIGLGESELWVQTSGADTIPTEPRLPLAWADRFREIPGVANVARDQAAYMILDGQQFLFEGVEPGSNVPFYREAGDAGQRVLAGEGILVNKGYADKEGLRIGDRLEVPTPAGRQSVEVLGISDVPVVAQNMAGVDFARFQEWFGRTAVSSIEIDLEEGADIEAVRKAVVAITAEAAIPVNVVTGEEVVAGSRSSLRQSVAIFNAMIWVVVGATALAILNTMAIAVVERRRELGILRAVGTSRRTIRRMVTAEAAAITVAGFVMGVMLGLVQHRVGVEAMTGLTGFSVDYQFIVTPLVIAAVASVLMSVGGSIGPAWRAGKVEVIEAIGYE